MKQCREKYILSAETIDIISQLAEGALAENGTGQKDILRIRLSMEEILGLWLEKLGAAGVIYKAGEKFGRPYIEVWVEGVQTSPENAEEGLWLSNRLLSQAGLALAYTYKGGRNGLTCNPPKKAHMGQMMQLVLALALAVCLAGLFRIVPENVGNIAVAVTEPLFNTFLGVLRAISSPLIFFAVCWGIISIGDIEVVGKIGKRLITRMISRTFVVGILSALLLAPFFEISKGGGQALGSGFAEIYMMVLNIIPSDIVSPFLEGNALQIIFLGVCTGMALLVLGQRVSAVQELVIQINEVMNFMMGIVGKLVPVFVFLSIFNLLLGEQADYMGIVKILLIVIPACLLLCLIYIMAIAVTYRVSPLLLVKKLLPTFLIGLSTSSSSAAFGVNLETCIKELGIPKKVANFAIPLGQVIYKPDCVVCFMTIALCMAEYYQVDITVMWLVTAVLTTVLLAMATPPVPGGMLSVFTVMFAQLGIPGEAIALAIAVNSVLDFVMTAASLTCQQAEVTLTTGRLHMLDEKRLVQSKQMIHERRNGK